MPSRWNSVKTNLKCNQLWSLSSFFLCIFVSQTLRYISFKGNFTFHERVEKSSIFPFYFLVVHFNWPQFLNRLSYRSVLGTVLFSFERSLFWSMIFYFSSHASMRKLPITKILIYLHRTVDSGPKYNLRDPNATSETQVQALDPCLGTQAQGQGPKCYLRDPSASSENQAHALGTKCNLLNQEKALGQGASSKN